MTSSSCQFTTVDWIVDSTRERARLARAEAREQLGSNSHLANGSSSSQWGQFGYAPGERPPRWWPTGSLWGRRAWWVARLAIRTLSAGMDSGVVVLVGEFEDAGVADIQPFLMNDGMLPSQAVSLASTWLLSR